MPANRPELDRAEKTGELLAIAQRLFRERGYAGTTLAAIAAEAGVAPNVIHWYFSSKDALFAAALEALQIETLAAVEARAGALPGGESKQLAAQLVELVGRLVGIHGLIAAVHERANHSDVVAEFHERAHARYAAALRVAVARCGAPEREQETIVDVLLLTLEGLVMHRASESDTRRTIPFLIERLVAPDGEETAA